MASISYSKDVGAYAEAKRLHLASLTNADNGVAQDGAGVDTQPAYAAGDGNAQQYQSGQLVVEVAATLTPAATLDNVINLQDSADGITFANVAAGVLLAPEHGGPGDLTAKSLTQLVGGTLETLSVKYDVELARLRRYVRVQVTPTFSAADSALYGVSLIVGGARVLPVDADKL